MCQDGSFEESGCSRQTSICGTIYLEMDGRTDDEQRYYVSSLPQPGSSVRAVMLTYRGFCGGNSSVAWIADVRNMGAKEFLTYRLGAVVLTHLVCLPQGTYSLDLGASRVSSQKRRICFRVGTSDRWFRVVRCGNLCHENIAYQVASNVGSIPLLPLARDITEHWKSAGRTRLQVTSRSHSRMSGTGGYRAVGRRGHVLLQYVLAASRLINTLTSNGSDILCLDTQLATLRKDTRSVATTLVRRAAPPESQHWIDVGLPRTILATVQRAKRLATSAIMACVPGEDRRCRGNV